MSWKSKAWAVAGTIAALEEFKIEKMSACNSTIHSLHHQHLITKMGQVSSQVERSPPSSSSSTKRSKREQSEESFRKIMYLSCWGPN
ncbi:hypothetical protein Pint_02156 [Pistacia integerrima]|uniref:Uncharacterized protein n=1 Tax=Pistacia integerrima TaxID=434235 RepID=A0ACC0ZJM3_9ROSI|nr:hypothetical protein Pint_02156 [Pistacia integerrima]